jgi:hypothetical protein
MVTHEMVIGAREKAQCHFLLKGFTQRVNYSDQRIEPSRTYYSDITISDALLRLMVAFFQNGMSSGKA